MRRRVLWVAVTAVALAITVLGVPLAVTAAHLVMSDERDELQRLALSSAVFVSPNSSRGDPVELPATGPGIVLGVYDVSGALISGSGPASLTPATTAVLSGSPVSVQEGGQIVEAIPVTRGENVTAVVRAASPQSDVVATTRMWWLVLLGACATAGSLAVGYAAWQSRRLVRPLGALARAAGSLGEGDFSVRAAPSGFGEIDTVGDSLNRTAARLAALVERERSFAAYAAHQLRTPLTHLQLDLESGLEQGGEGLRESAISAMSAADRLSRTIDDVLSVARRDESATSLFVDELLDECRDIWSGPLAAQGRPLRVAIEAPMHAAASWPAVRQILHVLVDNASRHGRGAVTLRARDSHGAVALDVLDEGDPPPLRLEDLAGVGLTLAQELALAQSGRLLVDQRGPGTRFTLLLPRADI